MALTLPFLNGATRKKRSQIIAVDLGSRTTKAVLFERRGETLALTRYALLDAPVADKTLSVEQLAEHLRTVSNALLKSGRCRAAGLLDKFYKKASEEDKKDLKVIYTTPTFPDQTITVSARISAPAREKIIAALTAETGVPAAKSLLDKFAKNATHFIRAPSPEYEGLEDLLEGVIWGW